MVNSTIILTLRYRHGSHALIYEQFNQLSKSLQSACCIQSRAGTPQIVVIVILSISEIMSSIHVRFYLFPYMLEVSA